MKKPAIIAFVACLGFILAIATPAHATNILTNPGFETGALSPWAVGSNFCSGTCSPWSVSTSVAHSGSDSAVDVGNIELTQTFTAVDTSSITQLSFWMMHPLAQTGGISTMVVFGYNDGSSSSVTLTTSDQTWDAEDVTADLTSGKMLDSIGVFGYVPSLAVFLNGQAGSAFTYVDDFDIEVAGTGRSATPEPGALLLLGSGLIGAAGMLRKKLRSAE